MCITPSFVDIERGPTFEQVPVPCKLCWRCKANKINDYVGRSLCEANRSDWTVTLTLTYSARADLADKVITPMHFQKFIRSLRRRGHSVRYLVCGEYGKKNGRAHFHCILFGKGDKIQMPHQKNFHLDAWPHGFVYADLNMDERSLRYVCKYLQKRETGSWYSLSKKPPLGHEFFQAKARQAIHHGVMPSTFEYLPPGGDRGRPYLMSGATRREYLKTIIDGLGKSGELDKRKLSDWVLKSVEKYAKEDFLKEEERRIDAMTWDELRDAVLNSRLVQSWLELDRLYVESLDRFERRREYEAAMRRKEQSYGEENIQQRLAQQPGQYPG